uniref:Uncharacterized protein n=1 Tax=Anguilla anguilla TaxID=7936 RepID=A0A0E9X1P1_ANGAN
MGDQKRGCLVSTRSPVVQCVTPSTEMSFSFSTLCVKNVFQVLGVHFFDV